MYQVLLPIPVGINLTLVRKLLQLDDLSQLPKGSHKGQRTPITIYHDAEKIQRVLERVKKGGEYPLWEILFGWLPTATGILNLMLHPIIVLLVLTICLLLGIILYIKFWYITKKILLVHHMKSPNNVINCNILY